MDKFFMINQEFILFGAVGAVLGSFVNVVISRGPRGWGLVDRENKPAGFAWPPSTCESCGTRIKPWDLIPIVSYLLLRGQCRNCGAPIGFRHLIVEILGVSIIVVALARFGLSLEGAAAASFLYGLLTLAFIDAETGFLPDAITLPLAGLGLLAAQGINGDVIPSLVGLIVGGGGLWLVAVLYRVLRKREGLGGGDVKLMAALGAWLGAMNLPWVLLISSSAGLLFALIATARKPTADRLQTEVRFGPFLAIGAAAALIFGYPAPFS